MHSTHLQYDEVSQEDQKADQRLSGSLTADSPESSEEHPYRFTNKVESNSSPHPSSALVSSPVGPVDQQKYAPQRIHWFSPTMMVVSLLCGVALTVGHHAYYKTLDGQEVGSSDSQQWSLRFGNAFAVSTSLCLKTAVGIAYLQVLWRRLSKVDTSIRTINSSFDIWGNVLSFFNMELWKKLHIGVILALLLWCLPIPTLLAPATLSVRQMSNDSTSMRPVLSLEMTNLTSDSQFWNRYGGNEGPTPQLERVAGAVAFGGEILLFEAPLSAPNVSYDLSMYAPLVRCHAANQTEKSMLLDLASAQDNVLPTLKGNDTAKWNDTDYGTGEIGYLAVYDDNDNLTMGDPDKSYDKILIAIQRKNTTSWNQSDTEYIGCKLWVATIGFSVNITLGRSTVQNITISEPKEYKHEYDMYNVNDNIPESHWAYFRAVTRYVVGMEYYANTNTRAHDWHIVYGDVFASTLSYNSQFNNMTMEMATHVAGEQKRTVDSEKLRHSSFIQDIEQLALNVTISLSTDSQFCKSVDTNVTVQTAHTVYTYQPQNLFISYGIAILFSALSVGLGLYSIYRNGASYDASFSSISVAMQNEKVAQLLEHANATTTQPLNKRAGEINLRFRSRKGFIAQGMQNGDPGA